MSSPTTIRAKQIGDELGVVTTTFGKDSCFEACFQIYTVFSDGRTHLDRTPGGIWSREREPVNLFNAWVKTYEEKGL